MKDFVALLNAELTRMRLPPYYETPRFHTSIAWSNTTTANVDDAIGRPLLFDDAALAELEDELGKALREEDLWVGEVCVKIGKDVRRYPLGK